MEENTDSASSSTTMCEVCKSEKAKYTCPRCSFRTCSVPCVVKHKEERQCDGKRDRTAFVAIQDFTESNLRSDLHFLEEVRREVEQSKKNSKKYESKDFSKRVKSLLLHARSRGVYVDLMPKRMTRHQQNTTMYHFESNTIHWHVEWNFPGENIKFTDERFPDVQILQDSVDRHLKEHQEQMTLTQEEKDLLKPYTEENGRRYRILFKLYGRQKYCLMEKTKSLYENLVGKRVVEFPTLFVVKEECAHQYCTLSPDEEEKVMKIDRSSVFRVHHTSERGRQRRRGRGRGRGWGRGAYGRGGSQRAEESLS